MSRTAVDLSMLTTEEMSRPQLARYIDQLIDHYAENVVLREHPDWTHKKATRRARPLVEARFMEGWEERDQYVLMKRRLFEETDKLPPYEKYDTREEAERVFKARGYSLLQ